MQESKEITKALLEVAKAIENNDAVASVKISILLKKPKQSKPKK